MMRGIWSCIAGLAASIRRLMHVCELLDARVTRVESQLRQPLVIEYSTEDGYPGDERGECN